jgi:hypothetical protein
VKTRKLYITSHIGPAQGACQGCGGLGSMSVPKKLFMWGAVIEIFG